MNNTVNISKEQLQCLRRHLDEANRLLQGLEVREESPPQLSAKEKRIKKYSELLNAPRRRAKAK